MDLCRTCAGIAVPGISVLNPSHLKLKAAICKYETQVYMDGSVIYTSLIL
jgi:hypothetical protein